MAGKRLTFVQHQILPVHPRPRQDSSRLFSLHLIANDLLGICSPIGASLIFYPAMSSVGTWFKKNRALAFGVMASGSSLGGVIFPIMVRTIRARFDLMGGCCGNSDTFLGHANIQSCGVSSNSLVT